MKLFRRTPAPLPITNVDGPIAIIGNSHIAALKGALQQAGENCNEDDFVFWGATGRDFAKIEFTNGTLTGADEQLCKQINGGRYIDLPLADFKAIVIHAVAFRQFVLVNMLKRSGLNIVQISTEVLAALVEEFMPKQGTTQLVGDITAAFDGPVIVTPMPMPAKSSGLFANTKPSRDELEQLQKVTRAYWAKMGAALVEQPGETLSRQLYTEDRFSRGSLRLQGNLSVRHKADDFKHMNSKYGAWVLADVTRKLAELQHGDRDG